MSPLAAEDQASAQVRAVARARKRVWSRTGEPCRPPGRARVVARRRPLPVPVCAPRRLAPRWPWLVVVGVAVAVFFTGLGVFAGAVSSGVPEHTETVLVGRGQTLSELARQYAPGHDPAAVVARIRQLNDLGDTPLVPGTALVVPVESDPP